MVSASSGSHGEPGEWNERVVVLTGGSGNVGAATARAFVSRGARLVLLDRNEERARLAVGDSLKGSDHRAYSVDVTDEIAVRSAVQGATDELGRLDVLVNVVGAFRGGSSALDTPWAYWDSMISANLKSAVGCCRAVLPAFVAQGSGAIVNVASLAALGPSPGSAAYGAAKAALVHFTETLAAEVKEQGVRVNAILPGTIDTPQNRSWMSEADAAKAIDPDAIADVIVFLASHASRAVTGATIKVSGRQ